MDQRHRLGIYGKRVFCLAVLLLFGMGSMLRARAVDPKYYAVMVSAQVESSPARINLRWEGDPRANGYTISRRTGGSWQQVASVAGNVNSWTDNDVADGGTYEYRVLRNTSSGYTGIGFLVAGINAPLKDSRGKVVLLVDNTHATALQAELRRLEWDLAGDGWIVLRHDVSRNDSVPNIKNIIKANYNADPSAVKAVFIFGHVPVPYSGNINPDGHDDHRGAWPADMYYGDMDGNWTDGSTYSSGAAKPWNSNAPGDGKFDQSDMPSKVELAVGRVDFFNMTCYANKSPSRSELDLLRAYLNKDHNFRHRGFTVARRGLVCDNFGDVYGDAFAASGWRNFGAFFGAENVTAVGYGQFIPTLSQQDYLWAYGTGGGSYYTCNGIGGSDDFATTDIRAVFTMFLGSYFGDWDNESNFLRAPLGSGYCLTTSWAGRPHWFYHQMGLGESIGTSTIASQNNAYADVFPIVNRYAGQIHVALLGDPTLRMHPVIPPSNVSGNASGSVMNLKWSASSDTDLRGYHVYRGAGPNEQFVRLTSTPVTGTSFSDPSYTPGSTYMIRAIKLEKSGSGTYVNASQGAFYPQNATGGGGTTLPQTPAAPAALAASAVSASEIALAWQDSSKDETGFRIDQKLGSSGTWAQVGVAEANATAYRANGLAPGATYYFRVYAVNAAGASMPSSESSATTSVPNAVAPGAAFTAVDSTTLGNWKGTLGSEGFNVISSGSSYPGYATVNPIGKVEYQWSDYATDTRALNKASGPGRVIGCWFAQNSFDIDFNFIDGLGHKVSLYFCDWDRVGRRQRIDVLDGVSGALIDSRSISDFGGGIYLSWNLKGQVRLRVTNLFGPNAVVNGIFFDPSSTASGTAIPAGMVHGNFELQVSGEKGQRFEIHASDNLTQWAKISTIVLPSKTYNFSDSTSQGQPRRFYRAVAVP